MRYCLPVLLFSLCFLAACDGFERERLAVQYQDRQEKSALPPLPNISGYTTAAVERKIPPSAPGVVRVVEMRDFPDLAEFLEDDTPRPLRLVQKRIHPRALVILSGRYTFSDLYQAVKSLETPEGIIKKDGVYTLRMPLLVSGNASLSITDKDAPEVRLSRDTNAFIANSGNLFILRTKITGWDEQNKTPSWFEDKHSFRPFITNWSGGNLYIASSTVSSLGYLKGKSYGLSYSTCIACLKKKSGLPRPTGMVVDSRFSDMYYGFYSYEADDVAIVRNVYADNIVYGIDPHDRSRRLIIAENEAYGSKKKHGIIVSREVNDSWIFNNYSHDNHGSGIMIDRTSVNNIVANNTSVHNGADGITFFESQNNIAFNNTVLNNAKSGIRIRNSWNVKVQGDEISGNGGPAIELYTAALEGQETRDFELDPYTRKASAEVLDVSITTPERVPAFKVGDQIDALRISGVRMLSIARIFSLKIEGVDDSLLSRIQDEKTLVEVLPRKSKEGSGEGIILRSELNPSSERQSWLSMLAGIKPLAQTRTPTDLAD